MLNPYQKKFFKDTVRKTTYMDLAHVKSTPIEDLYDGDYKVNGKKLMGLCPFHDEDTPSFVIYTETNTFHCFGCGESGDVIAFYMKQNNMSFSDAVAELEELYK